MVKSTREYRVWEPAEEDALREGVRKHGLGAWEIIRKDAEFGKLLKGRTGVQLKDKWRNLVKFRHISVDESKTYKPKHSGPWSKKYLAAAQESERSNCSSPERPGADCKTSPEVSECIAVVKKEEPETESPQLLSQRMTRRPAAKKVLADYDTGSDFEEKTPSEGSRCLVLYRRKRRKLHEDRRFGIYDQRRYSAPGHSLSDDDSDTDCSDSEYIINCVCGVDHDDGEMMVECEKCKVWCHVACLNKKMAAHPDKVFYDFSHFHCDECQAIGALGSKQSPPSSSSVSTDSKHSVKVCREQHMEWNSWRSSGLSDKGRVRPVKRRASVASVGTQSFGSAPSKFMESFPANVRAARSSRPRPTHNAWKSLLSVLIGLPPPSVRPNCILSQATQLLKATLEQKLESCEARPEGRDAGLGALLGQRMGNEVNLPDALESLRCDTQTKQCLQPAASETNKVQLLEVEALDLPKDLPLVANSSQPMLASELPSYWLEDFGEDDHQRHLREYDIPEPPSLTLDTLRNEPLFPLQQGSALSSLEQIMRGPQLMPGTLLTTSAAMSNVFDADTIVYTPPAPPTFPLMQALGVNTNWMYPATSHGEQTMTNKTHSVPAPALPRRKVVQTDPPGSDSLHSLQTRALELAEVSLGLPALDLRMDLRPSTPDPWLMCVRGTTPTPEGMLLQGLAGASGCLSDLSASWLVSRHTPPLPDGLAILPIGHSQLPFDCIHAKGKSEDFADVNQFNFLNLEEFANTNVDSDAIKDVA